VIEQGNTYTVSFEPNAPTILASSSGPIHSLGFVLNAVHSGGGATNGSFQPLPATVKVLADEKVYRQYSYKALAPGKVSTPLAEQITLD